MESGLLEAESSVVAIWMCIVVDARASGELSGSLGYPWISPPCLLEIVGVLLDFCT